MKSYPSFTYSFTPQDTYKCTTLDFKLSTIFSIHQTPWNLFLDTTQYHLLDTLDMIHDSQKIPDPYYLSYSDRCPTSAPLEPLDKINVNR